MAENHIVQFYESEGYLCDTVAAFIGDGFEADELVVVVASEERREALFARLSSAGYDVEGALGAGRLTFRNARDVLDTFMTGDEPDPERFRESVGAVFEELADPRAGEPRVRVYGEMVDMLWRDGQRAATLRLEDLWNDLAVEYSFSLLCAYAMDNFYSEAHAEEFRKICQCHALVIPAETRTTDPRELASENGDHAREIALLQQRARSLEHEIEERKRLERALREMLAEQLRSEEELRTAKEEAEAANRAKSDFLTVMSHELRTPLNAIVGYLDLLQEEVGGPVTDTQERYLERIECGAGQLLKLIEQVLNLSRIDAGAEKPDREPVDLVPIAAATAEMLEPVATRKGLTLDVRVPNTPLVCCTDTGMVRQILLNLLSNAVKFTDAGRVEMHIRVEDGFAHTEVTDTGSGIPAQDLERIFEPFEQVDRSTTRLHGGTGIGLPVSRELARLLDGDLTVESAPGEGSRFTLTLPVEEASDATGGAAGTTTPGAD